MAQTIQIKRTTGNGKPNEEFDDQQKQKSCWVDFYPTYLNVMDMQVINKVDIITFFQSPPASGKCCASWNLIYRDNGGKTRMLSMRTLSTR